MPTLEQVNKIERLITATRDLAKEVGEPGFDSDIFGKDACYRHDGPVCAFGHALYRAGLVPGSECDGNQAAFSDVISNGQNYSLDLPSDVDQALDAVATENDGHVLSENVGNRSLRISTALNNLAITLDIALDRGWTEPEDQDREFWDDGVQY